MIMSDKEKDEFIRKRFHEDKLMVSREQVGIQIKNDIDKSNIKLKKHTYLERYLILFLIVLLIISVVGNVYLIKTRYAKSGLANNGVGEGEKYSQSNLNLDITPNIDDTEENEVSEAPIIDNEPEEAEPTMVDSEIKKVNPITPANETEDNKSSNTINEASIKEELTEYAITIGRYGSDASDLEKNTILLLIANDFFNNNVSINKGLEISSNGKYAMTGNNVHKFVKELVGLDVNGHLNSYTNYMKYNENSKFYSAGTDSTKLKDEKYEITSMNVTEGDTAGEYKVIGNINKKSKVEIQEKSNIRVENIDVNYSFEATLTENKNYTYVQYQIKDFVTELNAGDNDNIIRLVGIAEQAQTNTSKK